MNRFVLLWLVGLWIVVARSASAEETPPDGDEFEVMAGPGGLMESHFTPERKCPACCTFAASLRRTAWDLLEESVMKRGKGERKRALRNDDRVENIADEALFGTIDRLIYVPSRQRYAPQVYAKAANAVSQEDLELNQRQKDAGGDQRLISYLHEELREEYGEEVEALAGRDLTKGRVVAEDFVRPPGSGVCDPEASTDCAQRLSTFVLLKNKAADLAERSSWAGFLCKRVCGKRSVKSALPLEAEDFGVPSIAEQAADAARVAREQEAQDELDRQAAMFPPDDDAVQENEATPERSEHDVEADDF